LGGSGVAKAMGGTPTEDRQLQALAAEAAAAVGVSAPKVFEVVSAEPNAFAASGISGSSDTTVAVTSGLREILTDNELAAVLAHEMGHLKNRDVMRNMHVAAAAAGFGGVYETGRWLLDSSSRKNRKRGDKDGDGGAGLGMALMGAGLACQGVAHLLRLAASRTSELRADRAAAEAFGAQSLITALKKIDRHAALRPADLSRGRGSAYSHLMISDGPSPASPRPRNRAGGGFARWFGKLSTALRTHPSLQTRVEALEKAAADGLVPTGRASSFWS